MLIRVVAHSHVVQPLDRLILGLTKRFTRAHIYDHFLSDPERRSEPISLDIVLQAIAHGWRRATQPKYCVKSFAGILPADADILLQMSPSHVNVAAQGTAATAAAAAAVDGDDGDVLMSAPKKREFALRTYDVTGSEVEDALLALGKNVNLTEKSDMAKVSVWQCTMYASL